MQTMNKNTDLLISENLANEIVKILIEKKGIDVRMFNVIGISPITDYYINVTGRSLTHVASLADDLLRLLSEKGVEARQVEGKRGNSWLLVDYCDCIVNIFDKEMRGFYSFDRLQPPESECDITELKNEVDKKFEI